jgi:hypothetical protein
MPLHVRSIAVSIAVICFFGLSIICGVSGLSPFTCCKRALAGSVIVYILSVCAVKAINAILLNAMLASRLNKRKDKDSGP